ncbi:MAG: long-chain fatty acid--CoA ligase [Deltaproteobacteria bacterium]|nr:long-chain fatty acid--CoA ligase [Deltaproteobacteria bacterium]
MPTESTSRGTAFRNLAQMYFDRAAVRAEKPRYRVKRDGAWREVSWDEDATAIREIAAGLVEHGLQPGEKVAILSGTRPEWVDADIAIYACGAISVPIYQSNLPHECGYILANSESRVCFVENAKQLAKVRTVQREGFELDGERVSIAVGLLVLMEGEPDGADVVALADLRARGRAASEHAQPILDARMAAVGRDDLATIVYTSGTTGPPKGVMQTHGNHLAAIEAVSALGVVAEGEVDFFFLPLAHSFARMVEYLGLLLGTVTAFATSIDTLTQELGESRPHLIPSVPRIYEKIYARIMGTRQQSGFLQGAIFDWALGVGRERSAYLQRGEALPLLVSFQGMIADRLVFSRIHQTLGGRVRLMVSGGAPLAREIMEFFHAVGLLILEGYGLTETTPILTCNRPDQFRFGTVGPAIPNVTLRIAPDGEILAKGPNVAQGYYKRPEATAESWDAEGWFHTGDIGEIDADGFVRITDRKKDLIKTSGGKYVAPQNIENLLKTQLHISQAVVIGDNRKYVVALLTLDFEEVERYAAAAGIELRTRAQAASHPEITALVDREVQHVNKHLASYESIKYFRILEGDFSQETGELTPSLKVKRKVVTERYREVIDQMYGS